jgi:hypothetical protein
VELGRVDLGERGLAGGLLDERDAGAGVLGADGLAVPEQGGADFLDLVLLGFLGRRGGIAEVEGLLGGGGFLRSGGFRGRGSIGVGSDRRSRRSWWSCWPVIFASKGRPTLLARASMVARVSAV